uniref:Uncharacterized protein n=1 Tax=Anopheles minimus TaxID=112268 RepID=A0A182W4A0_9DIPT
MAISHPSESPEAGCSTISHPSESPEAGSSTIVSDVSFHSVYGTDSMVNFYQPYSSSYDGSVSATDSDCDARSYDVDITREQLKQFLVPANYYSDDSDDYDD